jgi:hypothetical protein
MAKSTLTMGAVALAFAGAVALETPSWASGATSAVKKPGPIQVDVVQYNHITNAARYQAVGATSSTEFSSANRTGGHNAKWK